jgi:hypothetical protein
VAAGERPFGGCTEQTLGNPESEPLLADTLGSYEKEDLGESIGSDGASDLFEPVGVADEGVNHGGKCSGSGVGLEEEEVS